LTIRSGEWHISSRSLHPAAKDQATKADKVRDDEADLLARQKDAQEKGFNFVA
jgi:hypothetical protein